MDLTALDWSNTVAVGGAVGGAAAYLANVVRELRRWDGGKAFALFAVLVVAGVTAVVLRDELGRAWDVIVGSGAGLIAGEQSYRRWLKPPRTRAQARRRARRPADGDGGSDDDA